jgi:cysteine-rich repeat protein
MRVTKMTDTTCTPVCGDGIKVGSEECDDGNKVDTDFCSNACLNILPSTLTCTGDATTSGSCAGLNLSKFVGDLICQDNRSCMGLTIGSAGYVPKSIKCKASMSCSVRGHYHHPRIFHSFVPFSVF